VRPREQEPQQQALPLPKTEAELKLEEGIEQYEQWLSQLMDSDDHF
jgi:hypothetical protein